MMNQVAQRLDTYDLHTIRRMGIGLCHLDCLSERLNRKKVSEPRSDGEAVRMGSPLNITAILRAKSRTDYSGRRVRMGDEDINNSPTEDERGALCWCCAYCGQNGFSKGRRLE